MDKKTGVTIETNSINGDGLWFPSISIYYSGCDKVVKCKDCHNPELQNRNALEKYSNLEIIKSIEKSLKSWLSVYETISISFLGGEPTAVYNIDSMFIISKYFKKKYGDNVKTILYSWRKNKELNSIKSKIKYIDFGVLGEFDIKKLDLSYVPSSRNQYIYDFNRNKKIKKIKKA